MGKSNDLDKAFGETLRELRLAKKLTQEQLGFEADLRRTFVSSLELGEKQPTLLTIFKLSKALKIAPSQMISLVEDGLKVSNKV